MAEPRRNGSLKLEPEQGSAEERALAEAEAAVSRAEAGRAKELERVASAGKERDELRERLAAADGDDAKLLARIASELTAKEVVVGVLEGRVRTAEGALEKARAAETSARRERAQAHLVAKYRGLWADRTRLSQELATRTEAFFASPEEERERRAAGFLAQTRQLLRELDRTWWAGWGLVSSLPSKLPRTSTQTQEERRRVWPTTPWLLAHAGGSDEQLLVELERVIRPPDREAEYRDAVHRADAATAERAVRRIHEARRPAPQDVDERGVGTTALAGDEPARARLEAAELARAAARERTADSGGPTGRDLPRIVNHEGARARNRE